MEVSTRTGAIHRLLADYAAYVECHEIIETLYRNLGDWARKGTLNVAGMGKFSNDRTVREYAEKIRGVKAILSPESKHYRVAIPRTQDVFRTNPFPAALADISMLGR